MSVIFEEVISGRSGENMNDSKRSSSSVVPFPRSSNPASSIASFRSNSDRHDIMVKFLHKRCSQAKWLDQPQGDFGYDETNLGVLLRKPDNLYTTEPPNLNQDLTVAVEKLNPTVAFTMSSDITQALLQQLTPLQTELALDPRGFILPIVNSLKDIIFDKRPLRDSYVCLCRSEQLVLLWGDSIQSILAHGTDIETRLLGLVWGSHIPSYHPPPTFHHALPIHSQNPSSQDRTRSSIFPISAHISGSLPSDMSEKIGAIDRAIEVEEMGDKAFDPEKESELPERKFLLVHAVTIGIAMILVIVVEMACVAKLITEYRLDGKMIRFALVATVPLFASFSLFYFIVIGGSLGQLVGPVSALQENSLYYSGKAPKPARHANYELPHITIQMPVYKEGLKGVIIPTTTSLLAAVKHYEERGGTASIFVNEDGMRCVSPEMQEARKAFYELNNIGWVARPKHNEPKKKKSGGLFTRQKKGGENAEEEEDTNYFIRAGHFKKASNMNYCLDFSLRVEDELLRLIGAVCEERGCTQEDLTLQEEDNLYEQARTAMLEQDEGRTWAAGNIRIGEIILIVDSDTRVPEDCLLLGALEMHESPEVALLQHASGIMQVVNNAFENGITYFTDLVYTSIQYAVGNGDCAPFVGHNTFIRWKAIQSIAFEKDGQTKFWSEDHVSEDFDVSLRLQINNFVVRLATYHDGGFKEGVSLTVYDEIARWEKYAYGCNELVFNPFIKWPTKGPITPLFWKFLWSPIKVTSKITILGYIGTYYAIASSLPLTLANYCLVGWLGDEIDQMFQTSWKIFVGMAVIFNVVSPLAYAMLRHRLGKLTFFWSLVETFKWMPFFLVFFGGISFHLLKSIFCHFFSIRIEWTTTAKELTESGFRVGLDRIVRDFKYMYIILFALTGAMIYFALFADYGWIISDFTVIVPLANQVGCHALLPFALGLF
ncbi:glycosyl transferase family group 2-domain-containing protein [Dendryphion nanum]|uniref:Glycosyl transferase family group 2-domain-containing protein n=1 Tax=Dendryphion nanum TaxID=256645 RepID=A0A9P9DXB2_9PLEO|nr:glycosyl transferase family group 2-domain-containing protein [Dendryphion nanum]